MSSSTNEQPLNERRARARKEIKQLIDERNRVLSQYYHLASCADDKDDSGEPVLDLLQEFCQELIDYLATGHFELYRRIEDGEERREEIIKLAQAIFDRITDTTEVAVDFNDLYDTKDGNPEEAVQDLPSQLSRLGESLATRIDLEDQFINTLLAPSSRPALHSV